MGLLEFPNPVSWYESAKNAGLERQAANSLISTMYSSWLTFLWSSGKNSWWGEGQALRDAATAAYLSISQLETKDFLVLTVPTEMLSAANLSRFQTQYVKGKP